MSETAPLTLEEAPITSPVVVMRRYSWIQFLMFFLSILPCSLMVVQYARTQSINLPLKLLILPFYVLLTWLVWTAVSVILTRIFLGIVNLAHKPREGIFPASKDEKDFRYYNLRGTIQNYGFHAAHAFPLPWLDVIFFKILGIKTEGGTAFFDAWVDAEMLEVGDNTLFGLNSFILTSMVISDKLVLKRTRIGDYTLVGAGAVVGPGAQIGSDAVVGSLGVTGVGQTLEDGYIYMGQPCRIFKENKLAHSTEYKKTDVVADGISEADSKSFYGRESTPISKTKKKEKSEKKETIHSEVTGENIPLAQKDVDKSEKRQELDYGLYVGSFFVYFFVSIFIPALIFFVYYTWFVLPFLETTTLTFQTVINSWELLLIIGTLPLVFIGLYLLHLFLFVWTGRVFIKLAERKNPPQLGVFERDFSKSGKFLKWYHFTHFILRTLKWRVTNSMFPWLANWLWNFVGAGTIAKNVVLEDHFLGDEFMQVGPNSVIGQGVVVGTHTVEGVFGRVVIAGSIIEENCTVGPNTLMGPDAHLETNAHILPRGALAKAYKLRKGGYYWGTPVYKLSKRQVRELLKDVSPEGESQ